MQWNEFSVDDLRCAARAAVSEGALTNTHTPPRPAGMSLAVWISRARWTDLRQALVNAGKGEDFCAAHLYKPHGTADGGANVLANDGGTAPSSPAEGAPSGGQPRGQGQGQGQGQDAQDGQGEASSAADGQGQGQGQGEGEGGAYKVMIMRPSGPDLLDPRKLQGGQVDPAKLKTYIDKAIDDKVRVTPTPRTVDVNVLRGTEPVATVKQAHPEFPTLLQLVRDGEHVMLVGPAGTGKSHAAHAAADTLGKAFYPLSVGPQTTQANLMGYMDAQGRYVPTSFRKAFEGGGVFCLDEMDAGSAAVLTCLNSALSNGLCGFPDREVARHPDFLVIGTANTFGMGRVFEYIGRNQLDGAFLDRFAQLAWPVDEALEAHLSAPDGLDDTAKALSLKWVAYIQRVRKLMSDKGVKVVVSPRASMKGAKMLRAGLAWDKVVELYVSGKLSPEARTLLREVAP